MRTPVKSPHHPHQLHQLQIKSRPTVFASSNCKLVYSFSFFFTFGTRISEKALRRAHFFIGCSAPRGTRLTDSCVSTPGLATSRRNCHVPRFSDVMTVCVFTHSSQLAWLCSGCFNPRVSTDISQHEVSQLNETSTISGHY